MNREPVLTAAALAGLIMAFLTMAVSLGWLRLDEGQMQAIQAFVLPLAGLLLPLVAAWWARGRVTPTAEPATADGEPAILMPKAEAQAMGLDPAAWSDDEPLPTGQGRKAER